MEDDGIRSLAEKRSLHFLLDRCEIDEDDEERLGQRSADQEHLALPARADIDDVEVKLATVLDLVEVLVLRRRGRRRDVRFRGEQLRRALGEGSLARCRLAGETNLEEDVGRSRIFIIATVGINAETGEVGETHFFFRLMKKGNKDTDVVFV